MKQVGNATRLIAILALMALAAFAVAGCGGGNNGGGSNGGKTYSNDQKLGDSGKVAVNSDQSFNAEQQAVIETITAFGDATAAKDYKKICSLLATEAQKIGGDCVRTFRQTGSTIKDFKLTITSVDVAKDGQSAKATVSVTSNMQPKPQTQELALGKEKGEWKIEILGSGGGSASGSSQ